MNPRIFFSTFIFFLCLLNFSYANYEGEAQIKFFGSATVHKVHGHVKSNPFTAIQIQDKNLNKEILSFDISVMVDEMKTGNKKRDQKMHQTFNSNLFPKIQGTFKIMNPPSSTEEKQYFDLTIKDITRKKRAKIYDWNKTKQKISFKIAFDVSNQEFSLKFPSILFIKVKDKVSIEASIVLKE